MLKKQLKQANMERDIWKKFDELMERIAKKEIIINKCKLTYKLRNKYKIYQIFATFKITRRTYYLWLKKGRPDFKIKFD